MFFSNSYIFGQSAVRYRYWIYIYVIVAPYMWWNYKIPWFMMIVDTWPYLPFVLFQPRLMFNVLKKYNSLPNCLNGNLCVFLTELRSPTETLSLVHLWNVQPCGQRLTLLTSLLRPIVRRCTKHVHTQTRIKACAHAVCTRTVQTHTHRRISCSFLAFLRQSVKSSNGQHSSWNLILSKLMFPDKLVLCQSCSLGISRPVRWLSRKLVQT